MEDSDPVRDCIEVDRAVVVQQKVILHYHHHYIDTLSRGVG